MKEIISKIFIIPVALTLLACTSNTQKLIKDNAVDDLNIGMNKPDLIKVNPNIKFNDQAEGSNCIEGRISDKNLSMLIEDDILTRIYIKNPDYKTSKGIMVGSTEKETISAYGDKLHIEPHKYDITGHYLSIINNDGEGILFESDGQKIIEISVGKLPSLKYVERCL